LTLDIVDEINKYSRNDGHKSTSIAAPHPKVTETSGASLGTWQKKKRHNF